MIKFETKGASNCYLEARGSAHDIGCDVAYMITLIYKDLFNASHECAAVFRESTMYVINEAMNAVERGEFNDDHTT